jgi:hypothetical protein
MFFTLDSAKKIPRPSLDDKVMTKTLRNFAADDERFSKRMGTREKKKKGETFHFLLPPPLLLPRLIRIKGFTPLHSPPQLSFSPAAAVRNKMMTLSLLL